MCSRYIRLIFEHTEDLKMSPTKNSTLFLAHVLNISETFSKEKKSYETYETYVVGPLDVFMNVLLHI